MTVRLLNQTRKLLAAVMISFALVQLNDPDPLIWCGLYGWTAIGVIWGDHRYNRLRIVMGVVYAVIGVWLFPVSYQGVGEMIQGIPEIEEARESLGILIASGIWFITGWLLRQNMKSKEIRHDS